MRVVIVEKLLESRGIDHWESNRNDQLENTQGIVVGGFRFHGNL